MLITNEETYVLSCTGNFPPLGIAGTEERDHSVDDSRLFGVHYGCLFRRRDHDRIKKVEELHSFRRYFDLASGTISISPGVTACGGSRFIPKKVASSCSSTLISIISL